MSDPRLEAIRQKLNASKAATCEQEARNLLDTLEYPDAQSLSAGDVVELANLLRDMRYLLALIDTLQRERDELQGLLDAAKSSERYRDTE